MLVTISDLHFVDGTAGEHNLSPEAFREVFQADVLSIAKANNAQKVELLLLGDIFDLIRTEYWLDQSINERPWGRNETAIQAHAQNILDDILSHKNPDKKWINNPSIFKFFREDFPEFLQGNGMEYVIHYVPGNHDRLINKYPNLRNTVKDALGFKPTSANAIINPDNPQEWWFKNSFESSEYGVFARHGHEFDSNNFAGKESFLSSNPTYQEQDSARKLYSDYTPIGDVITTEIVAKLPYKAKKLLSDDKFIERLQEIENIRPMSKIPEWLSYQIASNRNLRNIIEEITEEVIDDFDDIPFVHQYDKTHGWLDVVDKVQIGGFLRGLLGTSKTVKLAKFLKFINDSDSNDKYAKLASKEDTLTNDNIKYIVYGHTHGPVVNPLKVRRTKDNTQIREIIYVNTGTWRSRHMLAVNQEDFVTIQSMTYAVFFNHKEDNQQQPDGTWEKQGPTFEFWSGMKKKFYI